GLAVVTTSGDINLGTVDNATNAVAFAAAGNVSYRSASGLTVTQVAKVGDLDAVSGIIASGGIAGLAANSSSSMAQNQDIQTSTLDISTAGSGNVTLTRSGNRFSTVQSSGGLGTGTIQVTNGDGALNVGSMTGSGAITIATSGGALTVTG